MVEVVHHRSLSAQIEEVEYELEMRARVYGRSPKRENVEHMLRMRCVLRTLQWLKAREPQIKHLMSSVEPGTSQTEPG